MIDFFQIGMIISIKNIIINSRSIINLRKIHLRRAHRHSRFLLPLDKLRQVFYIKYITNARKLQGVLENFVDKTSIQWIEIRQNCTMRRNQGGVTMNLYLRKDGRYESRVPNGKTTDGKRAFLYVLARTKEQCIERVQAIHRQNRPQGYCTLTVAELFSEWHRSILHRVKESTTIARMKMSVVTASAFSASADSRN